ncbi:MAG: OmpA family protein [Saprospiraceae bacterium]|nr:OmpA family protein [Saprospiraceae bacterium]
MKKLLPPAGHFLAAVALACLLASCAHPMKKGYRHFKGGKADKAEKLFKKYQNDPLYDLAAEYYLLRLRTKRARTLREWAAADSAFAELSRRHIGISPEKDAALKTLRARRRNVEGARLRFQRRAIQLADQSPTTALLDSVGRMFPDLNAKLWPEWDSARAHVVNRLLPTTDYETATSILNHHRDVVYPHHYRHLWKLDDDIWKLFRDRYALCDLHLFREDHPDHAFSKDCWFDEARAMFCAESVDSAFAFLKRYPYSALEILVVDYLLEATQNQSTAQLDADNSRQLQDLHHFYDLARNAQCELESGKLSHEQLYHYLDNYSPRSTAYYLLRTAADFYLKTNRPGDALLLLLDMRPNFPDTFVCNTRYVFQIDKQSWIQGAIRHLEKQTENLRRQTAKQWNIAGTHCYSAVSWDEGQEVYFTLKKGRQSRIMRSTLEADGLWSIPSVDNTLSMRNGATPLSMTDDGLEILLKVGDRLYISSRKTETSAWNYPIRIPYVFRNMSRACLAPDGSAILLDAADGAATAQAKPRSNLYLCLRNDNGRFHKPRPLGGGLNTRDHDINPYLCADGKTLFFCSDGQQANYGLLDVYVSRRTPPGWTEWSTPVNLGYGLNTSDDDYGFTWVPETGLEALITQINPCDKVRDIWAVDIPQDHRPGLPRQLRGLITDQEGQPLDKGVVEIQLNANPKPLRIPVSPSGRYRFPLPDSVHTVGLYVNVPGYFTGRDTLHRIAPGTPPATLRDTFQVVKLSVLRNRFVLRHGSFREGTAEFDDPRVYKELELLHKFVLRRRAVLHFKAYTDSLSRNAQALTEARGQTILRYLLDSLGTPIKRLSAEGRGATDPLCPNATAEGRACNRRVEIGFTILPPPPKAEPDPFLQASTAPARTPPSAEPAEPGGGKTARRAGPTDELFEEKKPRKRKWWQRLMFWKKQKKDAPAGEDDVEVEEF